LVLALAALAVPASAALFEPGWLQDDSGILLWLTPLVPAFLLAYYRGWRGAAVALALGMASIALGQVVIVVLHARPPRWQMMFAVVVAYLMIAQGIAAVAELLHRERRAAEALAFTDALTGLPNRRHAAAHLDRVFAAAVRGRSLTVVMFDLDHFKRFNDEHGHAVGDVVLATFAELLEKETRRMDLSARFGGEEFLTILSPCTLEHGVAFAERVRVLLHELEFPWGPVTVSAGVAAYVEGTGSPDLLVAEADRALYRAKKAGRDRVEVAMTAAQAESAVAEHPATAEFAATAVADGGAQPDARAGRLRGHPRPPLVVVVDDDPDVERSLTRMLVRLGYDVLDARHARHVLELFDRFGDRIDLLLADVIMPGMNGLTLVEELGRRGYRVRVVYMSGYVHGEVKLPGMPGVVSGFLEKPIETNALAREVGRVLAAEPFSALPG